MSKQVLQFSFIFVALVGLLAFSSVNSSYNQAVGGELTPQTSACEGTDKGVVCKKKAGTIKQCDANDHEYLKDDKNKQYIEGNSIACTGTSQSHDWQGCEPKGKRFTDDCKK